VVDDRYDWLWLYAVEPLTGESVFVLLPRVDGVCLQVFMDAFGEQTAGARVGLVLDGLDGSGSHRSGEVKWPEHVVRLSLPRYSPELNPAALIFREVRAALANRVFEDLAELEEALCETLRPYWEEPKRLISLAAFLWWREVADAIPN